MSDQIKWREVFACLLEEMAAGKPFPNWNRLVVTHYRDELLESVRRQLVRLAIAPENYGTFPSGHSEKLTYWADGLRRGDSRLQEEEDKHSRPCVTPESDASP